MQLGPRLPAMLVDAGRALLPSGRFRLRVLELDGEPISAQLFLAPARRCFTSTAAGTFAMPR